MIALKLDEDSAIWINNSQTIREEVVCTLGSGIFLSQ